MAEPATADKPKPGYGKGAVYWDDRYEKNPDTFEWLASYKKLRPVIDSVVQGNKDAAFLNVGCGTSALPEHMHDDGYKNITNNDISPVCIELMKKRNEKRGMVWDLMEVTEMTYKDDSFDCILDKGTLDTMCNFEDRFERLPKYVKEIFRVLKPGGTWFVISYGKPEMRESIFTDKRTGLQLDVELQTIDKSLFYYIIRIKEPPAVEE